MSAKHKGQLAQWLRLRHHVVLIPGNRINARLLALIYGTLLTVMPAGSQGNSSWQAGVAKVSASGLAPGTAFVYATSDGVAYLVTSAHVIGQENSPTVEFQAAPGRTYKAAIHDLQSDDRDHGLVWLSVQAPPTAVRAIPVYSGAKPAGGDDVRFVGYPQPTSRFSQVNATIMRRDGSDLVLSFETGPGFSGGPVLRDGQVVGMIWGGGAGEGKALIADNLKSYLDGADVPWGESGNSPVAPETIAVSKFRPGDRKLNPVDGLTYVWIPPGTFMMGCSKDATGKYDSECADAEKPSHREDISTGFWIGQTEVTVGAYQKWPEAARHPLLTDWRGTKLNTAAGDPSLPAVAATWQAAQDYCKWAGGLRLPTEREWEYAARAGSTEPRYGPLDSVAWYGDNSGTTKINSAQWWNENARTYYNRLSKNGNRLHPVEMKQNNSWNLYDMLGNVWEWVEDWYDAYPGGTIPAGGDGGQKYKVVRGGAWDTYPSVVRVSFRNKYKPEDQYRTIGFRCTGELR